MTHVVKWAPIHFIFNSISLDRSDDNKFPYNESKITFEDGFEPTFGFDYDLQFFGPGTGTRLVIGFFDQKESNSNPPEYVIRFRFYRFMRDENVFKNSTDQAIENVKRKGDRIYPTNESVITDITSSRKLILFRDFFSLFIENTSITECRDDLFRKGLVSDLYRNYFEINSQFLSFSAHKHRLSLTVRT